MYSKKIIKEYTLDLAYNKEEILKSADCNEDNPNYETYLDVLEEVIEEHEGDIIPKAYVVFEENNDYMKEGSLGVISCLITLGSGIDKLVKEAFENSDYLEGLFLTCFGDSAIFESSNVLYEQLKNDMVGEGCFMSARQEPGDIDTDMEVQKDIFNNIKSNFTIDVTITEGCMLNPTKSLVYFYNVSDKDLSHGIDHSCERCGNLSCVNRMKRDFLTIEMSDCAFVEK